MAFDWVNKRQAPLQIGFQRVTRFTFDYHCQGAKTSNLILWAAPSEYPIMKSSEFELHFIIMFSLCFIESSSYLYFVVISLSCCNFIIIIDFYYKQISFTKILSIKCSFVHKYPLSVSHEQKNKWQNNTKSYIVCFCCEKVHLQS